MGLMELNGLLRGQYLRRASCERTFRTDADIDILNKILPGHKEHR